MPNKWDEMRVAYKEAEIQVMAADAIIVDMAKMITGRLRRVSYFERDILIALKHELRNFNCQTKQWKP